MEAREGNWFMKIIGITMFHMDQKYTYFVNGSTCILESVQDFLIKLDMKPCMHLVEISIFFTKYCHPQTHQNYEQSRQKLGTFIKVDILVKYSLQKKKSRKI